MLIDASASSWLWAVDPLRLTRHARNEMRHLRLTTPELLTMLASPDRTGQDDNGNALIDGRVRGMRIRVVIAGDDPTIVITLFERRRGRES